MKQQLDKELASIEKPAAATQVRHIDAFKGSHGNVANYYKTTLSPDLIRSHYDHELEQRGWRLRGESKLSSWGRDIGESLRIYCKSPLATDIYFTGQNEDALGFSYSVSVSWRVVEECGY